MPKIIFTSCYLRDAPPAQLENYIRYVSMREGAEMVEESRQKLPATAQQKKLVRQIVRDIPAGKSSCWFFSVITFLVVPENLF